jgi:hypothetical protein
MKTEIDTRKVTGRRKLRFKGMDDISADVEQLARAKEIKALGNWSAGQVLKHLAISVNNSVDGFPPMLPGFVRFGVRLLMKNKVLYGEPSPGFRLPKKGASMLPPPTSVEDGFKCLREALQHFRTETKRAPHPAIGALTPEEWIQFHCRHSEMHLSFLVPASA